MSEQRGDRQYKALGDKLKHAREQRKQTLAEVSGAVEIDTIMLEKIETGEQRPSEDILLLLISHLELQEDDASGLWELAGYNDTKPQPQAFQPLPFEPSQPVNVSLSNDPRVIYTDMVHVMVNDFGVVLNFMQTAGPNGQPLAISRIGMSKEHAQSIVDLLQKSLNPAEKRQRSLPKPQSKESQSKDKA